MRKISLLLALIFVLAAHAEVASVPSYAHEPATANAFAAQSMVLPPLASIPVTDLELSPPTRAQRVAREPNQIGFAVEVAEYQQGLPALTRANAWLQQGDKAYALLTISVAEALSLRAGVRITPNFLGHVWTLSAAATPEAEMLGQADLTWSGIVDGASLSLLIEVPASYRYQHGDLQLLQISYIDRAPLAAAGNQFANMYPDTASCAIDAACITSTPLQNASAAVMMLQFTKSGKTYSCSGTLLADQAKSHKPYVYTANHCIATQAVADTVVTVWGAQYPSCASNNVGRPTGYVKLSAGARLLDTNIDNDHTLLLLNDAVPAGAYFSGWSSAVLNAGEQVHSVTHPNGDVKKLGSGQVKYPSTSRVISSGVPHTSLWSIDITQGAVQEGSSGGSLFTCDSTSCYLRGGVNGGVDAQICSPHLSVSYSRFDTAYPRLKTWLAASSTGSGTTTNPAAPAPTSLQTLSDCTSKWVEDSYPALFSPRRPSAQTASPYYYRYYATTRVYLGVSLLNQHLYYQSSSAGLQDLGLLSGWATQAGCQ